MMSKKMYVPNTVSLATCLAQNGMFQWTFVKNDPSIVYVKLYGEKVYRTQRFMVMNALENYFRRWGKIRDLGRLKAKYSHLGDFFVSFDDDDQAVKCSKYHAHQDYHRLEALKDVPSFQMKVW